MGKIGRAHPGRNKTTMLRRAASYLKKNGYGDVEIVWKWGSRAHELEAKKNGIKYQFYVLRMRRVAGYWMADVSGKDLRKPKNKTRTKVLLMMPRQIYNMSYSDFRKKWSGRSTFNLSIAFRP